MKHPQSSIESDKNTQESLREAANRQPKLTDLIELASGVRCLLVQDPRSRKCAAAVMYHVGHMSDPIDRPVYLDFCEHMLFLGNDKFPRLQGEAKIYSE